jgi:prepilin-type N-terminal cleavage/methylation domain-containing protein
MKSKHGFTIVELCVVIAVIGILATISIYSYLSVQQQAHDKQRMTSATVITESLEKYFNTNGEYPSVKEMTNADATTVKQLLNLTGLDSLVSPGAAPGSTANIWQAGAASSAAKITYTGNADTSASCLTGPAASDACTDYKIQYYNEQTNTVTTLTSRHASPAAGTPPANVTTPAAPTLAAALNGANVVATASAISCQSGAIGKYAFQSRTNDGTWSGYYGWTTSATYTTPSVQGMKFGFQVKTQCVLNDAPSGDSTPSAEATYIAPINAPATPSISDSTSGNITTWSWGAATCPTGTTTYYGINSGNDYDTSGTQNWWMGWSADQLGTTWSRDTSSQGYMYGTKMHVKCANSYATSPWSADSNVDTWLRPVAAPGGAYNWSYAVINGRTGYDWYWTEPACGLGTNSSFQWDGYIGDINNTNGNNLYWAAKGPYNHYWYGATAPSKQDPGWYTGGNLELSLNGASTVAGIDVYAAITYRCQNPNTLRSATGARTQSPGYRT